jgi:hypothetical protein
VPQLQLGRFVAECQVSGMTVTDLTAVHSALLDTSRRLSRAGEPLEFVSSIYLPSLGRWIGLFESGGKETVSRALKIAQLWSVEVHEAIEFPISDGASHIAPHRLRRRRR